jgi:hypothetical protein
MWSLVLDRHVRFGLRNIEVERFGKVCVHENPCICMGVQEFSWNIMMYPVKMSLALCLVIIQFCVMSASAGLPLAFRARWLNAIIGVSSAKGNDVVLKAVNEESCSILIECISEQFSEETINFQEAVIRVGDTQPEFAHVSLSSTREHCHMA